MEFTIILLSIPDLFSTINDVDRIPGNAAQYATQIYFENINSIIYEIRFIVYNLI